MSKNTQNSKSTAVEVLDRVEDLQWALGRAFGASSANEPKEQRDAISGLIQHFTQALSIVANSTDPDLQKKRPAVSGMANAVLAEMKRLPGLVDSNLVKLVEDQAKKLLKGPQLINA